MKDYRLELENLFAKCNTTYEDVKDFVQRDRNRRNSCVLLCLLESDLKYKVNIFHTDKEIYLKDLPDVKEDSVVVVIIPDCRKQILVDGLYIVDKISSYNPFSSVYMESCFHKYTLDTYRIKEDTKFFYIVVDCNSAVDLIEHLGKEVVTSEELHKLLDQAESGNEEIKAKLKA